MTYSAINNAKRLTMMLPRVFYANRNAVRKDKGMSKTKENWRTKAEAFELDKWYPSESVKRNLGSICRAVNIQDKAIELLGSEDTPLALLTPASQVPASRSHFKLSIDDVKADWPAITLAATLLGDVFRISGSKHEHAVLTQHPNNRHRAFAFHRAGPEDNLAFLLEDLRQTADSFATTSELIGRRFKEAWKTENESR